MAAPTISEPDAPRASRDIDESPRSAWSSLIRRPLIAGLVLLSAFVILSLPNDPAGFLGTDTGGKVATLEVIADTGEIDLDVGYWAADVDPNGDIHPLWFTSQFDDRWVQVTTVPVIVVAAPLYALGGYELALLLPMLGGIAAAFGARAVARQLGARTGWMAFWVVGLASPVTIYSLDFWEHTIGLAFMVWGVVAALEVARRPSSWLRPVLFGGAFGAAATMRTEALVYALVVGLVMVWPLLRDHRIVASVRAGVLSATAAIVVLVANTGLEIMVLGTSLRSGRAASAASSGGESDELPERTEEALVTFIGPRASFETIAYLVGVTIVVLMVLAVVYYRRDASASKRYGAMAALLQGTRLLSGLGFVPGALIASPIAAVGLGAAVAEGDQRRGEHLRVLVIALGALPLVWAFQYTGGAAPQWAGRYILLTGLLLAVIGANWLDGADRWAKVSAIALAAAVTASGIAWMWVRTNSVADTMQELADRPESVLVSDIHHFWREGGAFWVDSQLLTVVDEADREVLADVLDDRSIDTFAWVQRDGDTPPDIDGYRTVTTESVDYLPNVDLSLTVVSRTG